MQSTEGHVHQTTMISQLPKLSLFLTLTKAVLPTKMCNVCWAIVNYYGENDRSYYKITCCTHSRYISIMPIYNIILKACAYLKVRREPSLPSQKELQIKAIVIICTALLVRNKQHHSSRSHINIL